MPNNTEIPTEYPVKLVLIAPGIKFSRVCNTAKQFLKWYHYAPVKFNVAGKYKPYAIGFRSINA